MTRGTYPGLEPGAPWYYRWRFSNWLLAKPWRIYPLSPVGWRYGALYRDLREHGDFFEPWCHSRRWALWATITFPHVHHEIEE